MVDDPNGIAPKAYKDKSAILPVDLQTALKHYKLQYKPQLIKKFSEYSDSESIMCFKPEPLADETWAIGGQILLCNPAPEKEMEVIESGEILEFDPDTGRIFVYLPDLEDRDISAFKLFYKPFDFATELLGAYTRLENYPEVLFDALNKALGVGGDLKIQKNHVPGPGQRDKGIVDIWNMVWSILWGPPGTGKTQNVANAAASHALIESGGKVLIVAPTNQATDEVAMRICRNLQRMNMLTTPEGCLVYRGGRGFGLKLSKEFPQCLRDATYARIYDEKIREIEALLEERDEALHRKEFTLASRITKQIQGIRATLPDETYFAVTKGYARVIVLTAFKALSLVGHGEVPQLVSKLVIDEAGMVSRASTAALITIGKSAIIAGDPKQIRPIFQGQEGASKEIRTWLSSSGLSHLTSVRESLAMPHVRFLNKQFRMHPDISKVVSKFTYDGVLEDADELIASLRESPEDPIMPMPRASCVVLDWIYRRPEEIQAKRAATGKGWERDFSAQIAAGLAYDACRKGAEVLILTPYRAQVSLIRSKVRPMEREIRKRISIGTIHKLQGTEREVLILDTVNAVLSWPSPSEIEMLLNVAVSRARKHFILIASHDEMKTPVLGRLASLLKMVSLDFPVYDANGQQLMLPKKRGIPLPKSTAVLKAGPVIPPKTLGEEIDSFIRSIIFTQEQKRLIERNVSEGHYLVRGVAGSGKTMIMANWAVRTLQRNPQARVLVTFFNKGVKSILVRMLEDACRRNWMSQDQAENRILVQHASAIPESVEPFDVVFVDESQDLNPDLMIRANKLCRKIQVKGKSAKNFILFHDDSQNIYGRKSLEEFKAELEKSDDPDLREFAQGLSFAGRTTVLREAMRSTQPIISFAFNMALDPKQVYSKTASGLKEFLKVSELAEQGLLIGPEESESGLYEARYADDRGKVPIVVQAQASDVLSELCKEVKHLVDDEKVNPGAIMVITTKMPGRVADELAKAGIKAKAYGGSDGIDPKSLPADKFDHVRCTTVYSSKGHESPIVMFAGLQELEDLSWITGIPKDQLKKSRRCMMYVAFTRAMFQLYIFGSESPFMDAARAYAGQDKPIQLLS